METSCERHDLETNCKQKHASLPFCSSSAGALKRGRCSSMTHPTAFYSHSSRLTSHGANARRLCQTLVKGLQCESRKSASINRLAVLQTKARAQKRTPAQAWGDTTPRALINDCGVTWAGGGVRRVPLRAALILQYYLAAGAWLRLAVVARPRAAGAADWHSRLM